MRAEETVFREGGVAVLVLLLWFGGAAAETGGSPADPEPGLQQSIVKVLEESEIEGAAIRTIGPEAVSLDWGRCDVRSGQPMSRRTRMRAGSISKLVTALLVLRAERAGLLSIDDDLERYLGPTFKDRAFPAVPVRIAHLLEHTSGLAGSSYREYALDVEDHPPSAYVASGRPFELRWPPGLHFSYANAGPVLAAHAVELAWGDDFDALMRREVFRPLGMRDSSFSLGDLEDDALSSSYLPADARPVDPWQMSVRPSGGLVTTADDLSRLLRMLIARGRTDEGEEFLSVRAIERMKRGQASLSAAAGAGEGAYGLGNFPFVAGGFVYRGHWGRVDGFQANLGYDVGRDSGFVIFVNTADRRGMHRLRETIGRSLGNRGDGRSRVGTGKDAEPARASADLPVIGQSVSLVRTASGLFVNATHEMPIRAWIFRLLDARRIMQEGSELRIRGPWPWSPPADRWIEDSPGVYRRSDRPLATGSFAAVGDALFWIDGESYRRVPGWLFYLEWFSLVAGSCASLVLPLVALWSWGRRWLLRRAVAPPVRGLDAVLALTALAGISYVGLLSGFIVLGLLGELPGAAVLGRPGVASGLVLTASLVGPSASWLGLCAALPIRRSRPLLLAAAVLLSGLGAQLAIYDWVPLLTWIE